MDVGHVFLLKKIVMEIFVCRSAFSRNGRPCPEKTAGETIFRFMFRYGKKSRRLLTSAVAIFFPIFSFYHDALAQAA
jgi:hypothetical protein